MKLIDLHCDTIARLYGAPRSTLAANSFAVDIAKLRSANSLAQVFALFVNSEEVPSCLERGKELLEILQREVARNADAIAFATRGKDIRENEAAGKLSALVAIEEGGVLEGDPDNLRFFYDHGVRFVTLTWNHPNEIGFPHGSRHGHKGLTPFGLDLLGEMRRLGVIADVSHLSEAGFWDVAKHSTGPFMATHSNCRALKEHSRNLTDAQIKALADKGGVMGVSVVKAFLMDGPDKGRVEAMAAHILHAINVGGVACVAIGTDFDGTALNRELTNISDIARLEPILTASGMKTDDIEKIFWKNALRVIDDVVG